MRMRIIMITIGLAAVILSATSTAQTIPGTLTYTVTSNGSGCSGMVTSYYTWTFTDPSGVHHYFAGTSEFNVLECKFESSTSLDEWSTDGIYYLQAKGSTGSVTAEAGQTGYIDPKYVVVGVTYAPPGPSSNTFVQYTNSTLVGSTVSVTNSFTSGVSSSVSLSYGANIPFVANAKISTTYTNGASQTSSTTSTVSTSMLSSTGMRTSGTDNYFAPVDNDYDIIWVWLNPTVILTVTPNSVVWNGYGVDSTDEPGMDVVGIAVGYLNGDFGAMPPGISSEIARSWANTQMFASGQGPGLTSADLANILAADPFSSSAYGNNDITNDPPDPETPDHRFTLTSCNGQTTFSYLQSDPSQSAPVFTCTLTYTNMSSQAQQTSSTTSQSYSVDSSFSGTSFLSSLSVDMKTAYSLSWTTGAQSTISSTTTSTASLSVQGPACNNSTPGVGPCIPVYDAGGNQPTSYAIYQDNLYGTFMLAPVNYYQ